MNGIQVPNSRGLPSNCSMSTAHSKGAWQSVFTGAIEQHQEHLLPEVIGLFAVF